MVVFGFPYSPCSFVSCFNTVPAAWDVGGYSASAAAWERRPLPRKNSQTPPRDASLHIQTPPRKTPARHDAFENFCRLTAISQRPVNATLTSLGVLIGGKPADASIDKVRQTYTHTHTQTPTYLPLIWMRIGRCSSRTHASLRTRYVRPSQTIDAPHKLCACIGSPSPSCCSTCLE